MSNHSFNPFIAKKYGIIESILISSIIFWTQTNAAKGKNYFSDRYWCFGTPEYFTKYFMYLTARQIQYALKNLNKKGALLKNNFNKKGYDKTNWYSLSDALLIELNLDKTCLEPASALIGQICSMDKTNLSDGSDKFVRPIPDTKQDTKQKEKLTNCESSSSFSFSETLDKSILLQRLPRDSRSDEEFLSHVTVLELDTSALECTSDQELDTSALQCTKLVHSNALNYCTPVHTYNKDNNKDNKTTTTVSQPLSSSSFFSEKQKTELLKLKLQDDPRSDEDFLSNCQWHIEKQKNEYAKYRRVKGLFIILNNAVEAGEHFKADGFTKKLKPQLIENKSPSMDDFQNYKRCVAGFEWVGAWMQKQKQA